MPNYGVSSVGNALQNAFATLDVGKAVKEEEDKKIEEKNAEANRIISEAYGKSRSANILTKPRKKSILDESDLSLGLARRTLLGA